MQKGNRKKTVKKAPAKSKAKAAPKKEVAVKVNKVDPKELAELVSEVSGRLNDVTTVKNVKVAPISLGEYNNIRGWGMPEDEDPDTEGYLVVYPDSVANTDKFEGYVSWTPKEPLDKAVEDYLKLAGSTPKDVSVTETKETSDGTLVHGNPDLWVCLAKTGNEEQGWMKSTKVMRLGNGCLVQVTTQQGDNVTEALTFAPGAKLRKINGNYVFS